MSDEDDFLYNPNEEISTCREELEMKDCWEFVRKIYNFDENTPLDKELWIDRYTAARVGIL